MIILRKNLKERKVHITGGSSNPEGGSKELVVVDLTVGERYRVPEKAEWYELKEGYTLRPGRCVLIRTQEKIQLPNNVFACIISRGGLSGRGLVVSNTKIDPLFVGPLNIPVFNGGRQSVRLERGASFCSVVFHLLEQPVPGDSPRDPVDPGAIPQVHFEDTFHEYLPHVITGLLSSFVAIACAFITIKYTRTQPQPSQLQSPQVQPSQLQP